MTYLDEYEKVALAMQALGAIEDDAQIRSYLQATAESFSTLAVGDVPFAADYKYERDGLEVLADASPTNNKFKARIQFDTSSRVLFYIEATILRVNDTGTGNHTWWRHNWHGALAANVADNLGNGVGSVAFDIGIGAGDLTTGNGAAAGSNDEIDITFTNGDGIDNFHGRMSLAIWTYGQNLGAGEVIDLEILNQQA